MEMKKFLLQELLTIKNGKDHKSLSDGMYPVFGTGGLMRFVEKYLYNKVSILLPRKGTLKNIQYVNEPFWTVDTLYYTVINEKIADPYYLYCYINSLDLSGYDSGVSIPSMTQKSYNKIKINLPSKDIQESISGIVKTYDELLEKNKSRIEVLEHIVEEIYKEWFVRFRFPGYEKYKFSYSKPHGWIYGNVAHNQIPENWHYGQLNEIGQFVRGKNITSDQMVFGDVSVISAGIQPSGYHTHANVKGSSLTMSASGANAGYLQYNLEDIWAADCSYYQNDENIWFVYSSLKFIESAIKNLQVGAAQPHVYPKNINKLNIIIPEEKYIKLFQETVVPMFEEIKILRQKNQNLTQQRDLLLPRLMSGKLEVK